MHVPVEETVVVPSSTAAGLAVATSGALYEHSPVVVLASDGDVAGQARAASVAVGLGGPLLLAPTSADPAQSAAVRDELARLGPEAILSFGDAATRWAQQGDLGMPVVAAPADIGEVEDATGRDLGEDQAVAPDQAIDAIASIDPDQPPVLAVDAGAGTSTSTAGTGDGEDEPSGAADLPRLAPDAPLDTLLVLVARDPASLAAAATARASGARLMAVANPDPRTDPEVIAALAAEPPGQVVALGTAFGSPETLRYRLDVAASGVELPGGGQILYPGRQMIALYGHPGTPALGVLGEQGVEGAIARAQQMAADYQPLVDVPVVPAFEIITSVASNGSGPDGNYSYEAPLDLLRPWVDAAGQAGVYVVLDLQPGRTDFLTQAKRYEELLARPYVGLALDPEWRLQPDQRHLVADRLGDGRRDQHGRHVAGRPHPHPQAAAEAAHAAPVPAADDQRQGDRGHQPRRAGRADPCRRLRFARRQVRNLEPDARQPPAQRVVGVEELHRRGQPDVQPRRDHGHRAAAPVRVVSVGCRRRAHPRQPR